MTRRISDLQGQDPYALLEVSSAATVDDIQRAYRRAMREAHPDMVTGDEDRTKLLNIARDVLLDPDLRAEYDRRALGVQPEPPLASAWDAEDIVVDEPPTTVFPPRPPVHSNPYSQPYVQPVYMPPPVYGPAYARPGSGVGLGVWALIAAVLCTPVGAILGIVALMQNPKPEGANKVCAIVAVCWGGLGLLCCVGYLLIAVLGSSLSTVS